jgi:hypothetical protein
MRACVTLALVATVYFASFGVAHAASTFDVTGRVTANDGTPIAGASVVLVMEGVSHSARSDAHGNFLITAVPAGTYALRSAR